MKTANQPLIKPSPGREHRSKICNITLNDIEALSIGLANYISYLAVMTNASTKSEYYKDYGIANNLLYELKKRWLNQSVKSNLKVDLQDKIVLNQMLNYHHTNTFNDYQKTVIRKYQLLLGAHIPNINIEV